MIGARALALAALAACTPLEGFGGPVPPLATFTVEVSDPGNVIPAAARPRLHVALVWGQQWLTEALCVLPPESPEVAAVLAKGCRDPFGFVAARVAASVPIELGVPATIELMTLPGADVLVGNLTARGAFGSFVVFDDLDGNGNLELARPDRVGSPGGGPPRQDKTPTLLADAIYGASFVTMTEPDQRVAYREGAFDPNAAFYPRAGCDGPPPAFSILAASGFTAADAIAATLAGRLPRETDPAACRVEAAATPVVFAAQVRADRNEVACTENNVDSSVRYRDPGETVPDLTTRPFACAHLPSFGGPPSSTIELIVAGDETDSCVGLTHFVLKGCGEDASCPNPDWQYDIPPAWWPCPR